MFGHNVFLVNNGLLNFILISKTFTVVNDDRILIFEQNVPFSFKLKLKHNLSEQIRHTWFCK